MEYERKYKAALKWMQSLYSGLHGATKEEAEKYFPELKDSEDERIVKCLLNYFNHVRYNGLDLKGTDVDEVIAWLEKQDKKLNADKVIEWLRYHIQVDEPKIEYNEDGQPLAESFIAHAKARCMAADEVIEQFKKDFGL